MEANEPTPKPWWLSKGVWGPIIAIASVAAQAAGASVDVGSVVTSALELVTVLGVGLGWWGRVEATRPIDKTQILPGVKITPKSHFGP